MWYQRRDFDPSLLLESRKADTAPWWPALVLLGWFDADLQQKALKCCDEARRRAAGDQETLNRADRIARMIFRLDEAVFDTLREVTAKHRSEVGDMLSFQYNHVRRVMNFRILAELTESSVLSAASLAQDGFQGVITLLRLASRVQAPSDEAVEQRLFGSLGDWLPENLRRTDSIRNLNVDAVARLSADLVDAPWAPDSLRKGAETFLRQGASDLFVGAGSPDGVYRLANKMARGCRDPVPSGYRRFYEAALLGSSGSPEVPARLSESFTAALAAPFFDRKIPRQKESVERLLKVWRALPAPDATTSRIENVLRADFGRVLTGLVKGEGRRVGDTYLWEPADKLQKCTEPLTEAADRVLRAGEVVDATGTERRSARAPPSLCHQKHWGAMMIRRSTARVAVVLLAGLTASTVGPARSARGAGASTD